MKKPSFDKTNLEQVCNVLGDTGKGLSGNDIEKYLRECGIDDPTPQETKRIRLFKALFACQSKDGCAEAVFTFIQTAMNPALYVHKPKRFKSEQKKLNRVLSFQGLRLNDEGKLEKCEQARTISEAEAAADHLRHRLISRDIHPDVLEFCKAELVDGNYFHSVLEAAKSVAQKIRDKTGLTSDGAQLVDQAFGMNNPVLAFNSLSTDPEKSEHRGLMNLMKGFFGTFRNPTAHAPRIVWELTEQDALDMLTIASLLHRRIDNAYRMGA